MKKRILIVTIALICIGGIYVFYTYPQQNSATSDRRAASENAFDEKLKKSDFSWRVEKAPNYEETLPRQIVYLEVNGRSYKAGESMGCTEQRDAVEIHEITRQTCWFAGGGDVYGVFFENSTYILKHRWIQESGGPEVNAAPEGPWETIVTIQ